MAYESYYEGMDQVYQDYERLPEDQKEKFLQAILDSGWEHPHYEWAANEKYILEDEKEEAKREQKAAKIMDALANSLKNRFSGSKEEALKLLGQYKDEIIDRLEWADPSEVFKYVLEMINEGMKGEKEHKDLENMMRFPKQEPVERWTPHQIENMPKTESFILNELVRLATMLDKKGLYSEANSIDIILKLAAEGIPPYQYDILKKCVDNSESLEHCNKMLKEHNQKHHTDIPPVSHENYEEMKKDLNK